MEEGQVIQGFSDEMRNYVLELLHKGEKVNAVTDSHSNLLLSIHNIDFFVRVDDVQLLFIGACLLPNVLNYLVNILPQFIYPYVVAYLQDLSKMRQDPLTVTELYNFIVSYYDGNILDSSQD